MVVVRRFVALGLGAAFGWVFLTQPLPISVAAASAVLLVVLHWDRPASVALIVGLGIAFSLMAALSFSVGWLVVGLALAGVPGFVAVRAVRRRSEPQPQPVPTRRLVAIFATFSIVFGVAGLPVRPGEEAVRTGGWSPQWLGFGCGGVGLDAVVRGDKNDARLVWLESQLSVPGTPIGQRSDVVWPFGYRVRFTPNAEVLDGWGNVVLRAGDHVSGSCGGANDDGTLNMAPPFN